MGRVGAVGDNAAMESFCSQLQKNVLTRRAWATRGEILVTKLIEIKARERVWKEQES